MFLINSFSPVPVYEQIISQTENFILTGVLSEERQVPSIRELSASLPANPRTIQKAYADLEARKLIVMVPGKGCFVASGAKERLSKQLESQLEIISRASRQCKLAGIDIDRAIEAVHTGYADDNAKNRAFEAVHAGYADDLVKK